MDRGFVVPLEKAAEILNHFGITADTKLDWANGLTVTYNGMPYWILQREVWFPPGVQNSPDGWHVVYSPSEQEVEIDEAGDPYIPDPNEPDIIERTEGIIDKLLLVAGLGIGAYVIVNAMGFFKK